MKRKISNVATSVHARLLNKAKQEGRPFNEILQYYAMERVLYRISKSARADRFVLKGALALRMYGGLATRATKDIDLLGRDVGTVDELVAILKECLVLEVEDDGLRFDAKTVRGDEIRIDAEYGGVRLRFHGYLGNAKLALQVDIGFGDLVFPDPVELAYPALLEFNNPKLLAYRAETIVAEKLDAMIVLDMANTRLKDFLDIWTLAIGREFSGKLLSQTIQATLDRRKTSIPSSTPVGLTASFYDDPIKKTQWRAFLRKANVDGAPEQLADVVAVVRTFVAPILEALNADSPFEGTWPRGGPWQS